MTFIYLLVFLWMCLLFVFKLMYFVHFSFLWRFCMKCEWLYFFSVTCDSRKLKFGSVMHVMIHETLNQFCNIHDT